MVKMSKKAQGLSLNYVIVGVISTIVIITIILIFTRGVQTLNERTKDVASQATTTAQEKFGKNTPVDEEAVPNSAKIDQEPIDKIKQTEFDDETSKLYADLITEFPILYSTAYTVAKENDFDPALIMGLITIESGVQLKYNNGEYENGKEIYVSSENFKGVCQISKDTWETYGREYSWNDMDSYKPNIIVGIRTLKAYLKMFDYELSDALVAYNWGPGNVERAIEKINEIGEYKKGTIAQYALSIGNTQSGYYPRRVLETAYYFKKVLEKAGVYEDVVKFEEISPEYITKLPAKPRDGVILKADINQELS